MNREENKLANCTWGKIEDRDPIFQAPEERLHHTSIPNPFDEKADVWKLANMTYTIMYRVRFYISVENLMDFLVRLTIEKERNRRANGSAGRFSRPLPVSKSRWSANCKRSSHRINRAIQESSKFPLTNVFFPIFLSSYILQHTFVHQKLLQHLIYKRINKYKSKMILIRVFITFKLGNVKVNF